MWHNLCHKFANSKLLHLDWTWAGTNVAPYCHPEHIWRTCVAFTIDKMCIVRCFLMDVLPKINPLQNIWERKIYIMPGALLDIKLYWGTGPSLRNLMCNTMNYRNFPCLTHFKYSSGTLVWCSFGRDINS